MSNSSPIICSACLLGVKCRYDGESKPHEKVLALLKDHQLVPVCPEQLGGMSTPRVPSERRGDRVVAKNGSDVTVNYQNGAQEALHLAKLYGCQRAILKARSPSCGKGKTYDGTFTGTLIDRDGVCAELLGNNGIEVVTEEEL